MIAMAYITLLYMEVILIQIRPITMKAKAKMHLPAAVAVPLAEAHISIFGVSTYDTDYVLVADADLEHAISVLESAGHVIQRPSDV